MHPLRTRLVRDMLPVVVVALAVVGALSLGMSALGTWVSGYYWMANASSTLPGLLELALAQDRLRVAEIARTWPARAELLPGEGLVVWSEEGTHAIGSTPVAPPTLDRADPLQIVTRDGHAWAILIHPVAPPDVAIGLVTPIGHRVARSLADQRQVEVVLAVGERVVGSSLLDLDGASVDIVLPPQVSAWVKDPGGPPALTGHATLSVPRYRGMFPGSADTVLRGADEVPVFLGAVRVPSGGEDPFIAMTMMPREVMLRPAKAGGLVFLALVVVVTALTVAALVSIAHRHLNPVLRGVHGLRALVHELARHLGDEHLPAEVGDDLSAVEEAARTLDRSIARAIEVTISLANACDRAEEASALKSRFLTNISHELRTPLTAIMGYAELLEEEATGDTAIDIGRIRTAATHLLALVDDVLDLARIEAGKEVLTLRPFALPELLEEVRCLALPLASRRCNELQLEVAPNLGEVVLDRDRVRQILLNLVGNAAKFTEHGRIVIEATRTRDRVRLTVRDEGCGIEAGCLPTLFQPFVQANGATEKRQGGTGLGLAISAQLTALMGGHISVESALGVGSAFTVRLPVDASVLKTPISASM
jgi:signal transduction histidine kinase